MRHASRHTLRIAAPALAAAICVLGSLGPGFAAERSKPAPAPVPLSDRELALLTGGRSRLICIVQHAFEGCAEGAAVGGQIGGPAGARAGCVAGAVIGAADGLFNKC